MGQKLINDPVPGAWSKFVFGMLFVSHCNHRGRNADLVTTRTLLIALHKASKDPKIIQAKFLYRWSGTVVFTFLLAWVTKIDCKKAFSQYFE